MSLCLADEADYLCGYHSTLGLPLLKVPQQSALYMLIGS